MSIMERCVAVLDALAEVPEGLSQAELSAQLGLAKPTVSRLVLSMCQLDLLRRDDVRKVYVLGPAIIRWGMAAVNGLELRVVAHPHLEALREATGETVHLAVLDGASVVYLDRLESPQPIRMASRLGATMPAHSTSLGKCLLAYLPADQQRPIVAGPLARRTSKTITDPRLLKRELEQVRARGFAIEAGENEDGVGCVAAPLFDHSAQAVAAISVSSPEFRLTAPDQHAAAAVMTANAISAVLGYRSPAASPATS
ncbi:MAG: putative transcriptional regulator, IclR family [Dactylosporangium sp.]|jgi:DNA-binding IclR family transcriptional regulator|nr:putative transcriptional regulator, IclR family [Dactylosporangium sp.]